MIGRIGMTFEWLPWYLQLLLTVPLGIYVLMCVFRFVMAMVDLIKAVKP